MAEYHTVSLGKTISYAGYFDFAKLWQMVRDFVSTRQYLYLEKEHNEIIRENGKDVFILVVAIRDISDYAMGNITLRCTVSELKDVEIERAEQKLYVNDGKVSIEFEGYVVTDYEGRFGDKGWLFFMRTMLEKLVYSRQVKKFHALVQEDLDALAKEIKAYLNLFSY